MKKILLIIYYALLFMLIGLNTSSAQEAGKKEKDAKEALLNSLHPLPTEVPAPMGINLLTGYRHQTTTDFEGNQTGQIWKEKGVKIRYEIGRSQGPAVDLDMKNHYQWYKEQIVSDRKIKLALDRKNVLLITIPLDKQSSWHAANFYGEIKKPKDMVDMILMILTFVPN